MTSCCLMVPSIVLEFEVQYNAGHLNRELMGEMIFRDEKLRAKLNTATHLPVFVELIRQVIIAWLQHVPILVSPFILPSN